MLPLATYAHLLDLTPPSVPHSSVNLTPSTLLSTQLSVLAFLLSELPASSRLPSQHHLASHYSFSQRDSLLRTLLTVRDPRTLPPLPKEVKENVDLLTLHRSQRNPDPPIPVSSLLPISFSLYPSTPPSDLPAEFSRIKFHHGDFTRLSGPSTAVVNPANTALLGCFQPSHLCADNVIHTAAGPGLREDCAKVVEARGWEEVETAEDVVVTKAGCLEVGLVLHVAGPQLRRGEKPTKEQKRQLETVYSRCLDLAEELGTATTIAFPCISTGLFAFPPALAAQIALRTVASWLSSHPSATSSVKDVVFVLFSPSDVEHYRTALSSLYPSLPPPLPLKRRTDLFLPPHVKDWIAKADSVIIHAGAGLSADAVHEEVGFGLDYTSEELFEKLYPGLLETTEMRTLYHSIGHEFGDPLIKWAFLLTHGYTILTWSSRSHPNNLYSSLLSYASSRPSGFTILTSNADQLFLSSGFPAEKVFTPQGSYATFQCTLPSCAHSSSPPSTFSSWPFLLRAHQSGAISPSTMRIPEDKAAELIPTCPRCGKSEGVFFNVRGGSWFDERPTHSSGQRERYEAHIEEMVRAAEEKGKGGFVLLLEVGAGFTTPAVVRWPSEELLARYGEGGRVKMVRVNLKAPEVGVEVEYPDWEDEEGDEGKRDVAGVKMGAEEFFKEVGIQREEA